MYTKWQNRMGEISLGECSNDYKSYSSTYHLVLWSVATHGVNAMYDAEQRMKEIMDAPQLSAVEKANYNLIS
jgi:hypothetical protein